MAKEVVTIQVGTNANYVGSHFWNLQDEYLAIPTQKRDLSSVALLSELSPRNRAYASGVRYTPRLQIIDASGAFGALSTQAGIVLPSHREKPVASAWNGDCQVFEREPVHTSQYIGHIRKKEEGTSASSTAELDHDGNLASHDIKYWTDYLKVPLHQRSSFQLPGIHHEVSNLQYFTSGEQIAKPVLEDMFRDLRRFVEECDSLGGLNVITNADDAFSGISSAYLQHALEELGSALPVMMFGIHSIDRSYTNQLPHSRNVRQHRSEDVRLYSNEAQLVSSCIDFSVEYIPMVAPRASQLKRVHLDERDIFQTSSVFGLTLDVALVPLRQPLSMSGMLGSIRPLPFATIGSIACNLPLPNSRLHFGRSLFETEGTVNLSSLCNEELPVGLVGKYKTQLSPRYFECTSARGFQGSFPIHSNVSLPVTLPASFPRIFNSKIKAGDLPDNISAVAGIGTAAQIGQETLQGLARNLQVASDKQRGQTEAVLSEVKETLICRAEDYKLLSR